MRMLDPLVLPRQTYQNGEQTAPQSHEDANTHLRKQARPPGTPNSNVALTTTHDRPLSAHSRVA